MIAQSKRIEAKYKKELLNNRHRLLTERQLEIYNLIRDNPGITMRQIMMITGITRGTCKQHMENLFLKDLIKYEIISKRGLKGYSIKKRIKK
jgi:DNA-binding CsgD family transcriptional regulator